MTMSITNTSDLPQKFGFVRLPPEIRVVPNQGFGTVLPKETVKVDVLYSPAAATGTLLSSTRAQLECRD